MSLANNYINIYVLEGHPSETPNNGGNDMKKFIIAILVIICTFMFVACSAQTSETSEVEAIVVKCEKGVFMPHEEYLAQANISLAFKKMEAYVYFKNLADQHGSWQYNVTVQFEGEEYTISRMDAFDVGTVIPVTATFTYSDGNLIHVECE